jgi:predicted negative regulator of RcsB-dependent stress response
MPHYNHFVAFCYVQVEVIHRIKFLRYYLKAYARSIVSVALWLLGYPEQARERSHEALTLARERANPNTLANTLVWAAWLHQCRREGLLAQERAEDCITLATGYGSVGYVTQGTIMRGGALVQQGQGGEGIAQLRQGLAAWRAALLAEAYGHIGQIAEGLSALAEALAFVHTTGERAWEAELYRLQGELLRLGKEEQERGRVDECFHQALEIASRQQAKSLELRAAMSLSRLWQRQGKQVEARELLAEIYSWFTEGFDTTDLQEAKALLEALGS